MLNRALCISLFVFWSAGSLLSETLHGLIASSHPMATDAGLQVFKGGGNAIDAAVAVALTLNVVEGYNSGIGGGCYMLIRLKNGSIVAIDGRETAPRAARRTMFVGKPDKDLSQVGALASGVPGALAAFEYAVEHYGRKKLSDLLIQAAELAERGFMVDPRYATNLQETASELVRFKGTRVLFFKRGKPLQVGDIVLQKDLGATYRHIAESGTAWFYRGPFAERLEQWMNGNGGIMSADDLRDYQIELRQPIRSTYHGFDIVGFPPSSSGGVLVAEILNILENFDLKAMDEPTRLHVMAEAMKLAFADRAHWLGDPAYTAVPKGLLDKKYAAGLAAKINLQQASKVAAHGLPAGWKQNVFPKHTTHISVTDTEGNWVACTATLNTSFGSKVIIPGTGVLLNSEMDDFATQPGGTNYFGLVGGAANAVAPGKRPLSSMSPTLVFKNGQPLAALGAAGGPKIVSQVVQVLVGMLDMGMTTTQALAQARIHHQWFPDELMVEKALAPATKQALAARGHNVKEFATMGVSQIVALSPDGKQVVGASDPRIKGKAEGW